MTVSHLLFVATSTCLALNKGSKNDIGRWTGWSMRGERERHEERREERRRETERRGDERRERHGQIVVYSSIIREHP